MEKLSLELVGNPDSVMIGGPRIERASKKAAYYSGKIIAFRVREILIQISALTLTDRVSMGKLLHLGLGSSSAKQYAWCLPSKFVIPGSCFPVAGKKKKE